MLGEAEAPAPVGRDGQPLKGAALLNAGTGKMPYSPPPLPGGIRMMPKADAQEVEEEKEIGPDDPVPWYVDIDFPPIIQKDTFAYMQALEKLATMLPTEVLEAKKLVVELALSVFGVNDVDKVLERIYPPDMVGVLVPPAAPVAPVAPVVPGQPEGEVPPATLGESISDIRRRRLLHSVREAGAAVAGAG